MGAKKEKKEKKRKERKRERENQREREREGKERKKKKEHGSISSLGMAPPTGRVRRRGGEGEKRPPGYDNVSLLPSAVRE